MAKHRFKTNSFIPVDVQVMNYLEALSPGDVIEIANIAKNDPEKFVNIVKGCIDAGCPVELSRDMTKLRRLEFIDWRALKNETVRKSN